MYRQFRDKASHMQDVQPPNKQTLGIPLALDMGSDGLVVFKLGSGCGVFWSQSMRDLTPSVGI